MFNNYNRIPRSVAGGSSVQDVSQSVGPSHAASPYSRSQDTTTTVPIRLDARNGENIARNYQSQGLRHRGYTSTSIETQVSYPI